MEGLEREKLGRVNVADPESRLVKDSREVIQPSNNGQIAVGDREQMIMAAKVSQNVADHAEEEPMKKETVTKENEEKALNVHKEAVIIDCLLSLSHLPKTASYFEECLKAGVTALHQSIVADEQPNFYDSIEYIASWYQWYEKFSDRIIHVTKAKDIELAKKEGKLGIILGFQSTKPIENNIDFLDIFHKLGVRIMQLTYQRMNWVGSGCGEKMDSGLSGFGIELAKKEGKLGIILGFQSTKPIENNIDFLDIFHKLGVRIVQLTYQRMNWVGSGCGERTDSGLSAFGIEVIKRMNKLGILIDLSHCGDRTVMEAIEVSQKPVAFTHANPRALCNVVRNKSDEQIKALAEKGGVISLNLFAPFYEKATKSTLDDLLDMIDHVNKVAGINHIGLGFDFDPLKTEDEFEKWAIDYPEVARGAHFYTRHPKGMENISFLPQLTIGLLKRGYSAQEVKKILGGNNLNLFRKVWGE